MTREVYNNILEGLEKVYNENLITEGEDKFIFKLKVGDKVAPTSNNLLYLFDRYNKEYDEVEKYYNVIDISHDENFKEGIVTKVYDMFTIEKIFGSILYLVTAGAMILVNPVAALITTGGFLVGMSPILFFTNNRQSCLYDIKFGNAGTFKITSHVYNRKEKKHVPQIKKVE